MDDGPRYGRFSRRFQAALIDVIVILLGIYGAVFIAVTLNSQASRGRSASPSPPAGCCTSHRLAAEMPPDRRPGSRNRRGGRFRHLLSCARSRRRRQIFRPATCRSPTIRRSEALLHHARVRPGSARGRTWPDARDFQRGAELLGLCRSAHRGGRTRDRERQCPKCQHHAHGCDPHTNDSQRINELCRPHGGFRDTSRAVWLAVCMAHSL